MEMVFVFRRSAVSGRSHLPGAREGRYHGGHPSAPKDETEPRMSGEVTSTIVDSGTPTPKITSKFYVGDTQWFQTLTYRSIRRGRTWPWHSEYFSKFGHSSEFRAFSWENIENLVLNLRPGSVY